jgi:hypothetical protein
MSTLATTNIKHPSSASNNIVLDSAGGVGINTASPGSVCHVAGSNGDGLTVSGGGATGVFRSSASGTELGNTSGDNTVFLSGSGTERMMIDSAGNVMIDSTSVSQTSDTGVKYQAGLVCWNIVVDSATGTTSHLHLYNVNATNNGFRFYVNSNGGIANFQANNINLSDRNAKKDISPAADTWNCLKEWEIVNYRYKDQPDDADLNLGVIAQQVAESCPEVITVFQEAKEAAETEPAQEERLGVKEQQMYWMAIKALQEAQVRIEQLEAAVTALQQS